MLLSTTLSSQEQWEIDMIEEDSKFYFDAGTQIYNVAHNIIEFDYQIENLDTTSDKGRLKYDILSQQRSQVLEYALREFGKVIEYYPTSSLLNQAIYNKAQIHFELNQIDSARNYYLTLVEKEMPSDLDTSEITEIYDERYLNLKNFSYKNLSEIEYEKGNYQQSITYLNKAEEIGYNHFCGNEYEFNSKYLAISYAKNYYELDSIDKSIELLIPHIFRTGLTSNHHVVELALEYMLQKHDSTYLVAELEKGFNDYVKKKPRPSSTSNKYFMKFLNQDIRLFMHEPEDLRQEKKMVMDLIKNELIYKLLKGEKPNYNDW